jgi:glutaredoxin
MEKTITTLVLWGAEWCSPCKKAKKTLEKECVPYVYMDIEENELEVKRLGIMQVPSFQVGNMIFSSLRGALEELKSDK